MPATLLVAAQPDLTFHSGRPSGLLSYFVRSELALIGVAIVLIAAFIPILWFPDARLPTPARHDAP